MIVQFGLAVRDLRQAWRAIVRIPALAAVVVVSLGVGIGVNTVVFSWIQAVIFQPLAGVDDSGGFYLIEPRTDTGINPGTSWLEYRDLRERLRAFEDVFATRMTPLYVGEPGRVDRAYGQLVSANFFSALGLRPALGRFLRPEEGERPGSEPVVVISYDFWRDRFGSAPDVLNRPLRVNGREMAIVGVAPRGFQGTVLRLNFDLWLPATMAPLIFDGSRELDDRDTRAYGLMARLKPSVTQAQAQNEVDAVMRELAHSFPATNIALGAEVLTFWQAPRGPQRFLGAALILLQAIMLLVLLAVCGNTANLVLARASTRQREIGVRMALGAGPWRIASLMLAETTMLGLAGAALGIAIALWGTQALPDMQISGLPVRFQTTLDVAGLTFAVALGLASGLLFGAAAAVQLARVDPLMAFRSGAKSAGRSRLRNGLMGAQVALATIVLVAAGLFFRSFMDTREMDPGFRREGVLLAAYDLTGRASATNAGRAARQFSTALVDRLRTVPAIEAVAIASSVPLDIHGLPSRTFTLEGRTRTEPGFDQALTNTVTPGYFTTLGIALCEGRDFVDLHDTAAPPQVIVNEAFVRQFLGAGENARAIGRGLQTRNTRYVIVGVARDSLYNAFGEGPTPALYFSYRDRPALAGEIHLRARAGADSALAAEVRRAVHDLDPDLPIYNVRTMGDHIENNLIFRRVPARMFVVLGPLLLILAAIGIYAVVAYSVAQRTTEIGVRLALGASARAVMVQFVGQSLSAVAGGLLIGWAIAFIAALDLVPTGVTDLPVFAGVPALLLTIATIACWVPARRATRVNPMVALRHD